MLLNFVPEWCSMLHALAQRFDVVQSRIPWNIKWTSPTTIHQKNGGSIVRSPIRASYVATCTSTRVGKWDRWVCLLRETTLEIRPFLATGSIFPFFPFSHKKTHLYHTGTYIHARVYRIPCNRETKIISLPVYKVTGCYFKNLKSNLI